MVDLSFSIYDLEYFLLILMRVSAFVYIAPFFGMQNTPARVKITLSIFISYLLYKSITPSQAVEYGSVIEFALIVLKESVVGLIIGFGANICMTIVSFAGSIADMETGLSMVTLMDPTTRQQTSFTGVLFQYVVMLMLIASGLYRYLLGALADTFEIIPINGAVFRADSLLESMLGFMVDYVCIGFRIILPIFCVMLLLNAILGVLAKVSPQLNMFAVGIQLKLVVGLSVLYLMTTLLSLAAEYIFDEMKEIMVSFVKGLM